MLVVDNHSFVNVLFLWDLQHTSHKSIILPTIVLQLSIFQGPFLIQARCLLKQKLLHDLLKIFSMSHGTISHLKCLEMATSCNNWSVTGYDMIEKKLSFMNEVSALAIHTKKIWFCFVMYVHTCQHNLKWITGCRSAEVSLESPQPK